MLSHFQECKFTSSYVLKNKVKVNAVVNRAVLQYSTDSDFLKHSSFITREMCVVQCA